MTARCISVPFDMTTVESIEEIDVLGTISCFLQIDEARDDDSIACVMEGFIDPIVGGYRMNNGMLVLVTNTIMGGKSVDVVDPIQHKLYYAGTMRATPAKRFAKCPPGKSWYYQRDKRERLTNVELNELLVKHGGSFPIALECNSSTEIPEATLNG